MFSNLINFYDSSIILNKIQLTSKNFVLIYVWIEFNKLIIKYNSQKT